MRHIYSTLFFISVVVITYFQISTEYIIILTALLGAYIALSIGANDVSSSIGPAIESKSIKLEGAIILASIGNILGAVFAGGEVIGTLKNKIIDISNINQDLNLYIYAMVSAIIAMVIWLNLAIYLKSPISTSHAIVGAILGAGIVSLGTKAIGWLTIGKIALSWVITPILGGIIAILLLYTVKITILKKDKITSAKIWIPIYVAIISGSFFSYLITKGLNKMSLEVNFLYNIIAGIVVAIIMFFAMKWYINKKITNNPNIKIRQLFSVPLILGVGLLTFAHGANDVANAIGPLAGVYTAMDNTTLLSAIKIPLGIIIIGAFGMAIGVTIFGDSMTRIVGKIEKINQIKAFCIAISTAFIVIISSSLGLPVSSTQIAVGGALGIGILRNNKQEKENNKKSIIEILLSWFITVPAVGITAGLIFLIINFSFGK